MTVKAKGKGIKYQWVFVDPEDSSRTSTGKKVAKEIKELKGLVVKGATSNKLVLTKIPDALNGWSIYCHLYSNAYKMDTDPVVIELPGTEPAAAAESEGKDSEGGEEAKSGKTEETAEKKASDEEGGEDEEDEGATEGPKEFTVSASGNILYKADSMGNLPISATSGEEDVTVPRRIDNLLRKDGLRTLLGLERDAKHPVAVLYHIDAPRMEEHLDARFGNHRVHQVFRRLGINRWLPVRRLDATQRPLCGLRTERDGALHELSANAARDKCPFPARLPARRREHDEDHAVCEEASQ